MCVYIKILASFRMTIEIDWDRELLAVLKYIAKYTKTTSAGNCEIFRLLLTFAAISITVSTSNHNSWHPWLVFNRRTGFRFLLWFAIQFTKMLYKISSLSIHAVIALKEYFNLKNKISEYCFLVYTKTFRYLFTYIPLAKTL